MTRETPRFRVDTGTDWRGDPRWFVYDRVVRITVDSFATEAEARAYIAGRTAEQRHTNAVLARHERLHETHHPKPVVGDNT